MEAAEAELEAESLIRDAAIPHMSSCQACSPLRFSEIVPLLVKALHAILVLITLVLGAWEFKVQEHLKKHTLGGYLV